MQVLSEPWLASAHFLINEVPLISRALSVLTLQENLDLKDVNGHTIMAGATPQSIIVNDSAIREFQGGCEAAGITWFDTDALMRAFVLTHECLHVLLETLSRKGNRDARLWNIATDYINNQIFVELMGQPPFNLSLARIKRLQQVLSECFYYDSKFSGMSADEVYEFLQRNPPEEPKSGKKLGKVFLSNDQIGGEIVEVPLPEDLKDVVTNHIRDMRKGMSNISSNTARAELALVNSEPPIKFADIVHKLRDIDDVGEWSYRLPSRDTVWAPALGMTCRPPSLSGNRPDMLKEILFCVDVSGSIREEQVSIALNIFKEAFKFSPRPIRVLCVTTDIVLDTYAATKPSSLNIPRFGGTYLASIIPYIEEKHIHPSVVILVTDGLDDPRSKGEFNRWKLLNKMRTVIMDRSKTVQFPGTTFTIDEI